MLEKSEILIVILILLLTFYIVIAWGAKQKVKSDQSIKIKSYFISDLLHFCVSSNGWRSNFTYKKTYSR